LEDSLAAADVHLVSLLPVLEGLIVPSKVYGILAAGRPLIFIGDSDGDVARVISEGDCGIIVPVGNAGALVDALRKMRTMPQVRAAMGRHARQLLCDRYTLRDAVERWIALLAGLQIQLNHPVEQPIPGRVTKL
jgi:glycosyltransferase involved in cell wall biosynthesis